MDIFEKVLVYVFAIAQSVIGGLILYRIKKNDEKAQEAQKIKEEGELLNLEMTAANGKLSYACAMALKRGKANGEVEDAVKAYEEAKVKYYDFLNAQAIHSLKK